MMAKKPEDRLTSLSGGVAEELATILRNPGGSFGVRSANRPPD